jgi:spermidine synthase
MSTHAPVPVQPISRHRRKQRQKPGKPPATKAPARPDLTTLLLFAPAILIGALLLFAVQPLIARYVLPWFGGGPGIWTACMLFFQVLLLVGYLYAHLSVKHLPTRVQVILHVALLVAALALIPIIPSPTWKPADAANPIGRILLLLAVTIGLPYFVLSATSPLLQAWFVRVQPGVSPYRLFALSNLGSLLALIGYPTILEPLFTRQQQAWIWSGGLIAFALLCLACGLLIWKRAARTEVPADLPAGNSRTRERAGSIALWLVLPMIASVLLLSITNTMTEDVAATPLLWVIPLALYLLTFVIAFDSPRWYLRSWIFALLPLATLWLLRLQWLKTESSLLEQFVGYSLSLFVLCLFCHGELARRKPGPNELTAYYLAIAFGGAFGGALVAVVAPHVFNRLFELPLGVLAASGIALYCLKTDPLAKATLWAWLFVGASVFLVIGPDYIKPLTFPEGEAILARARNFYGTLVVAEFDSVGEGNPRDRVRAMNHGSTSHGSQYLAPDRRHTPTLYYQPQGGAGLTLLNFPRQENRRIGVVGLGAGTLAAYAKPGDTFRFYEINPDVERLARSQFTYLSDSPAKIDVVLGDARLALEREKPQGFDILVLDAFSGDSIPTHLLTTEAFKLYESHLAPDGVIAVHISSRSVDLIQVVLRQVERMRMSYAIINHRDPTTGVLQSRWMLLTHNQRFLSLPPVFNASVLVKPNPDVSIWTDDHINLMQVIRWMPN